MAYDNELADRIRASLAPVRGVDEKPMFGGLAFLVNGHMAVAVSGQGGLLVRVRPNDTEQLLRRKHVSPMVMGGREVRGWVRVGAGALTSERSLRSWVTRGADCAGALPPK
jgi:TfoX/Sxy family transcriptional regulator of competence genes